MTRLAEKMGEKDISISELAAMAGLDERGVYRIIANESIGKLSGYLSTWDKIAKALDVDLKELI